MKNRVTIRDVARAAGVSGATVSYVLNNVKKVSEETSRRIHEAVEELGYYPDYTAISLSKKKSNLIGVVAPFISNAPASVFENNQYYDHFLSGVESVSRAHHFDTMISGVTDPVECINWVKKRNLDGLILIGSLSEELYQVIRKVELPIICIDIYEEHAEQYVNVRIDDEAGGYLAAKHLLELGHREIAFLATSLQDSSVEQMRFKGFQRAFEEFNVNVNEDLVFELKDLTFSNGYDWGVRFVQEQLSCTAAVTVSDHIAIGAMKGLSKHGVSVPDDFSIIGFDDLAISQYITPELTTVRQNIFEKGSIAADQLIQSIEHQHQSEHSKTLIQLPVELVVRGSTKEN
ncbi:LacI family DNA-binding transcriptional regulator [Jeotgalibacillus sp. JSM ZJ347]|uniref:LacI family DNA-binding transcriptional regulator n=1 Tax=Jeotgalibacillus sp. JSM ZJ347 TaxID=3342117 RepID=UPI0035A89007